MSRLRHVTYATEVMRRVICFDWVRLWRIRSNWLDQRRNDGHQIWLLCNRISLIRTNKASTKFMQSKTLISMLWKCPQKTSWLKPQLNVLANSNHLQPYATPANCSNSKLVKGVIKITVLLIYNNAIVVFSSSSYHHHIEIYSAPITCRTYRCITRVINSMHTQQYLTTWLTRL